MVRFFFIIALFFSFNSYSFTLLPAKKHSVITGYTRAIKTMTVTAETSGRLTQVNLDMGETSDGSVFAVIDPVFTKFSIDSVENSIGKIDASVRKLENSIEYLKKEFTRVDSLYASQAESESRLDSARQSLDQAVLSREELLIEKRSLEINLAELREKLRRQYIRVPAGWQITSKPLEEGELVNAGDVIATAGDFRELIVPVFVDNAQIDYLTSRNEFDIIVDGAEQKGNVTKINPAFDETTRKRQAEIGIKMQGVGGLLVEIPVVTNVSGYMVDKRAVNERYANARIFSGEEEIHVQIVGRDGDMVILAPSEKLHVGMELRAVDK
ncbi:hypothetical protein Dacet_2743 [Denitrovibrio acetiphilus DSM 12809]|uniref:Efflux transporter, RND family, MFP subunit n=1 Tax=Denitrovibrio acetiphilus (strain DSM 12809 / NBRC 114555 / N2460) TaxID=522772 RepID=D4H5Q6_DENA2|nr:HlyD family efflux transporter periplasmic adaptor subunit [Denitrovibrio acetiphilus]ADD69497.1 hypothetical protein Dacet_2743 [Denitrovibrio acetiphilus DSM 12809]